MTVKQYISSELQYHFLLPLLSQVVGLLKESLLISTTPAPVKVARLYLLSDILHNSGAPV